MLSKDEAKTRVKTLVKNYLENRDKLMEQSEFDTRTKFIDRMFEALGWDVFGDVVPDEVEREQPVKTRESGKKKADYTFKINGITRLIVEAKALGEDIQNPDYETQAITYAFNRACLWAVLSNFAATRIYYVDMRGGTPFYRIDFDSFDKFDENFETLWYLSKESVLKGALEAEAKKRGYAVEKIKIDKQLLEDLRTWRELLSSDIKRRQPNKYPPPVLDEIVQKIIDRLIFIRKAEDSHLEDPVLEQIVRRENSNTYGEVKQVFEKFRDTYDSKLFGESKATLHEADKVELSNQIIEKVIRGTLRPANGRVNYDFDSIDADVLGAIYEQYLAYILSQTPKRVKLEGGIAHRHEQGIYYTPTYIVDYIVRHTLGELLKGKSLENLNKVKTLDPACGSGSFLIKAYDMMATYAKRSRDYEQSSFGTVDQKESVPFSRKTRILQENIFGVDLDQKAVEITQLNLLMKIAERGEKLPVLQRNIRCGNSVVSDKSATDQNPLDWNEAYPEIIRNGGFDVIIGNPPYVRQEELRPIKPYLEANYVVYDSAADLFVYFFEREMELLKEDGRLGMIVSNKWLKAGYGQKLRGFLGDYWIERFIDFGDLPVFQDATTYPCIIIIKKTKKSNPKIKACAVKTLSFESLESYVNEHEFLVNQDTLKDSGWSLQSKAENELYDRIKTANKSLKDYIGGDAYYGLKTGLTKAYVLDEGKATELIKRDSKSSEILLPFLRGDEVGPYQIRSKKRYIILAKIGVEMQRYPALMNWLAQYKPELEKRSDQGNYWYELRACDYYEEFGKPKIIYGRITTRPRFAIDYDGYYTNDACYFLPTTDKRLLAILNSRVGWFLIRNTCTQLRGGYQLLWDYFKNVPISGVKNDRIEALVDEITDAKKNLLPIESQETEEANRLRSKVDRLTEEIEDQVRKIYGLSGDDFEVIKSVTPEMNKRESLSESVEEA